MTTLLAMTIQTLCAVTGVIAIVELGRSANWWNGRSRRVLTLPAIGRLRTTRQLLRQQPASASSHSPLRLRSRTTTHAPSTRSHHRKTISLL